MQKVNISDIIETMKSLNEDLKTGQFSQIYLLYGEENYLKKQYKERFVKAMLPQGDTMNYAYYEGKGVEIREVIDLAETLPFFAERRLIVFENTGLFKSSGADLAEYIKTMPETTYFIFVEEEVDKRSKLYKAVKAKGHIVELPFQDESTLKRWILGNVRREGKQISDASVGYFLGKVGTDMHNIQGELEKLFCYTLHRDVITPEDIDAVCINQIGNHIFEMVNAVAEKNRESAGFVLRTAGIKRASYENFIFAGQAVPDFIPCTVTAEKRIREKRNCSKSRAASVCCGKIYGADPVF